MFLLSSIGLYTDHLSIRTRVKPGETSPIADILNQEIDSRLTPIWFYRHVVNCFFVFVDRTLVTFIIWVFLLFRLYKENETKDQKRAEKTSPKKSGGGGNDGISGAVGRHDEKSSMKDDDVTTCRWLLPLDGQRRPIT